MDSAFFIASKTLGLIARAESWLILALALVLFGVWRGRRRLALAAAGSSLVATLALTLWPLGDLLLGGLESRYPAAPAVVQVDGIIVLGGAEETGVHRRWGGVQLNQGAERVLAAAHLARRFPGARLIYTGGEGALIGGDGSDDPSQMVRQAWLDLGIAPARITLEGRSRNTAENARLSLERVDPKPGERFVLVTSASHMPRAMHSFAQAGWPELTAWPVDFRSGAWADAPVWRLDDHLAGLNVALKEILGLWVYRVTGR